MALGWYTICMEKVDLEVLKKTVKAVHIEAPHEDGCESSEGCEYFDATFYTSPVQQAQIAQELIDLRGLLAYHTRGIYLTEQMIAGRHDLGLTPNPNPDLDEVLELVDDLAEKYRKYKNG